MMDYERMTYFEGGPFEGRVLPESMTPWPKFIPREPWDASTPRNLSHGAVVRRSHRRSHYNLVGLDATARIYRWVEVRRPWWQFWR